MECSGAEVMCLGSFESRRKELQKLCPYDAHPPVLEVGDHFLASSRDRLFKDYLLGMYLEILPHNILGLRIDTHSRWQLQLTRLEYIGSQLLAHKLRGKRCPPPPSPPW